MRLEDVAQSARVSTATVSRVLNNAPSVRSSTRARVMQAIEKLKYNPNLHARSLAAGKSRSIGIIVSNLGNPFFFDIYKALERRARDAGYDVLIANTNYNSTSLAASVWMMLGRRVAGLAAIVSEIDPKWIDVLERHQIPVVLYDIATPRKNIFSIRVDYRRGMEKLISHLYNIGHRHVGFVGHHIGLGPIQERLKVVLDSVQHYPGLRVSTAEDEDSLEGGRCAARTLLAANPTLTALVCVNDWMAAGALRELRERDLHVPADISVTGFDDINLAQFCCPALTTVRIPRDRIGQIMCDSLINSEAQCQHEFLIDPELVMRDSTGPAAQARRTAKPSRGLANLPAEVASGAASAK
jgi:LacI family transcriptional regulator